MNRAHEVISLLDDSDDDDGAFYAPPPIKVASRVLADKTIEILDSDDDDDDVDRNRKPAAEPSPKKRAAMPKENRSPNTPRRKLKKSKPHHSEQDDDEIKALDANLFSSSAVSLKIPAAASMPNSSNNNVDDDGIELVGSIGNNALTDFPHARENCVLFPFAANNTAVQHCPQCFCFVCDCAVAQCCRWDQHCRATYQDPRWKQERQRMQQQQQQQQASSASLSTSSLARASSSSSNSHNNNSGTWARWNHLAQQPIVRRHNRGAASSDGVSVQALLGAVTRVHPREQAPPPPFVTTLRHYQKQSLAFMVDVENSSDPSLCWNMNGMDTRGGWLCSEVGMGKSAVVIALAAANPFNPNQPKIFGRKLVKATVILTSISLMGQWEDECKKHAPHLKVVRFHYSAKQSHRTIDQIKQADIVISSATFSWEDKLDIGNLMFHRVVQDESHLFHSQSASAKLHHARAIPSPRRWCVTATPMTSTPFELRSQSCFLGMPSDTQMKLRQDPEFLKQFMIRHIKSQQIGGSQALALPKSTTTVQLVRMDPREKQLYDTRRDRQRFSISHLKRSTEATWGQLDKSLIYPLTSPLVQANSSKMKALESALVDLRLRDPNMRAVVFSQMREVLSNAREVISRLGIQLYHFDGSTSAKKRDEGIRSFQSLAKRGPAVFCITIATGSVGITLTAASHVFLMEPCINPNKEIQSAGRIHRLGQTKQVHVTKFVYADSIESNTVKLHKQVANGTVQFTENGIGNDALNILLRNV